MANETSTFSANARGNIKENVEDAIYTITPSETIFMNLIKKGECPTDKCEWLEDSLDTTDATPVLENSTGTAVAVSQPARKTNYIQRFMEMVQVTRDMEIAAKYGRKSEISNLMKKKLKETAIKIEKALLNNVTAASASTSAVGSTMLGVKGFITTNVESFSGTPSATNLLNETRFNKGVQACWDNGGKPNTVMGGGNVVSTIAGFTGNARLAINADASKETVGMAVNFYQSNFGKLAIYATHYINPTDSSGTLYDTMFILDKDRWELAWSEKPIAEKQAESGLVKPVMITGACSLKCYNEAANYKMTNIARV